MTLDIKDFFLQLNLNDPEYIRILHKYFPPDVREKYNIDSLVAPDGYVYCKIKKGMYGLKQAARLARDQLKAHLAPYGYAPSKLAPNIWVHKDRPTKFCLCVDDFGIKYYDKRDVDHLLSALSSVATNFASFVNTDEPFALKFFSF